MYDKIEKILNGRRLYSWGRTLGLTDGKITNMKNGKVPDGELLSLIQRVENVNLIWFLNDIGAPFNVTALPGEVEFLAYLHGIFPASGSAANPQKNGTVFVVKLDTISTLVIAKPAEATLKPGQTLQFTQAEVVSGRYSKELYDWLSTLNQQHQLSIPVLSHEQAELIIKGEVGTYGLFGDEKAAGLLTQTPNTEQVFPAPFTLPDDASKVNISVMRGIVELVEQTTIEEQITLSAEQKARVIAAAYNHAVKTGATAHTLDVLGITTVIDAVS